MEIITGGLTNKEQEVLKEVLEKFFNDIDKNTSGWEHKEITEYNKAKGKDIVV